MPQQLRPTFAVRLTLVLVFSLRVEGVDVHRSRLLRSERKEHKDTALSVDAKGELALATGLRGDPPSQSGDATAHRERHNPHEGSVKVEHEMVGCFPRAASDTDDEEAFLDLKCDNVSQYSADAPCRSGLPFFRLPMQKDQSFLDCFTFCLSKGLDLSGLLQSNRTSHMECRCGATTANVAAWHGRAPLPQLLLPTYKLVAENDTKCKLLVWRYTGLMQNGAVPVPLMQLSVSDEAYIDGIADHMDPKRIIEEDDPDMLHAPKVKVNLSHPNASVASLLSTRMICDDLPADQNGVGQPCSNVGPFCSGNEFTNVVIRGNCPLTCGVCSQQYGPVPCYPHACGPGGGPWLSKKSDGNVYINFFYESNIDANRRAVFEAAMAEWESKVCVRFVPSTALPRIRVAIVNIDSCSAGVGYPGASGTVDLNLGWCNELNHLGSVIHELGHAMGMNHEQNRADAAQQAYVTSGFNGPYLNVKWQNIEPVWRSQWEGVTRSYDGSKNAGYASYDYESIMHYGLTNQATAVNAAFQSVPGQRSSLSRGDIAQFSDMYQCNPRAQPQPQRSSAASPGCSDQSDGSGNGLVGGYPCSQWKTWGYCEGANSIPDFYCKVTCGTCARR